MKEASRLVKIASLVGLSCVVYTALAAGVPDTEQGELLAQGHEILIGLSVPSRSAQIASEQDGTIHDLAVAEGYRVVKDQLLFKLNSSLYELRAKQLEAIIESELAIEKGRSTLEHARRKSGRLTKLQADEVVSAAELEESQFEVQLARLQLRQAEFDRSQAANELEQLREQIRQRRLLSPFAGVVTEIYKHTGEAAEKLTAVLEVVSLDPLWVEFECPVGKQSQIRAKAELMVAPATNPSDVREAKVIHVSLKANPSSHTFLVRAAVSNPDYSWRMGLKMLVFPQRRAGRESDTTRPAPVRGK